MFHSVPRVPCKKMERWNACIAGPFPAPLSRTNKKTAPQLRNGFIVHLKIT
jgi:hypothetical protein